MAWGSCRLAVQYYKIRSSWSWLTGYMTTLSVTKYRQAHDGLSIHSDRVSVRHIQFVQHKFRTIELKFTFWIQIHNYWIKISFLLALVWLHTGTLADMTDLTQSRKSCDTSGVSSAKPRIWQSMIFFRRLKLIYYISTQLKNSKMLFREQQKNKKTTTTK